MTAPMRLLTSFYNHPVVKLMAGLLLGIVVALLIAFNALLLWVATGPRSLDRLSPFIEASFRAEDNSYFVDIGETWLIWDGWQHPIDIRLRNVKVYTGKDRLFSIFPEISLGVDVWSLPLGRFLPTSLSINEPVISLFRNQDDTITFGLKTPGVGETPPQESVGTVPLFAVLTPLLAPEDNPMLRKLRYISILNADVSLGAVGQGVFFKASNANIILQHNRRGVVKANTYAQISYGEYQSMIDAQFTLTRDSPTIEGEYSVSQIMPGALLAAFVNKPLLTGIQLPVSSRGSFSIGRDGTLRRLDFSLDGGEGSIASEHLDGILTVTRLHANGEVTDNGNQIHFDRLEADFDGMPLLANGTVMRKDGDIAIRANVSLRNAPAEKISLFWPPKLAPLSREWVVTNIPSGKISEASIHVDIGFGDLAKPMLPRNAIDANIGLSGATIRYLPEHPPVTNVSAAIHVDAVALNASIASADYMEGTKLSEGLVLIEDLNVDNPYIKVSFAADAPAKDIIRLLGLPRLEHAKHLNLNADAARGSAAGRAELGFHFFAPEDGSDDIRYDIVAETKGITHPAFMNKFDIKDAAGRMTVSNRELEFNGSGEVNGASVSEATLKYLFTPKDGVDTFIDATATAPVRSLPRFGYPQFPFLQGTLGVKATVTLGEDKELSEAFIDLTNATVTLDLLRWHKPEKESAAVTLKAEKKKGRTTLPSFWLEGKNVAAKGSMELTPDLSDIQRIEMEQLKAGKTDLDHLLYQLVDGGYHIEARGKSADASYWLGGNDNTKSTFSFENFPAMRLDLDIARLTLGEGREVTAFKSVLGCDMNRCARANMSGKTVDGKPFTLRILKNPKGVRQFALHAESAGAFLKAFHVFDGIQGGQLSVSGDYEERPHGSILRGRTYISEHVIKDAPILAKLLSLASLTGFFDTLQGKGIRFVKFRAPFTLANNVITLEDARTYGDAIGMTIDGTITFPQKTLDLKGTIVPSYTLNSVLGKIPLIGAILTGGEGKGVFAASYRIKGSTQDPQVTVNPLSMLTPGFLRGFFDVFDSPKKEQEYPD